MWIGRSALREWLPAAAAALVFLPALAIHVVHATAWFSAFPGDLADTRFANALLEHQYLWLTGRVEAFLSPGYFYPFERVLGFGDQLLGNGFVYVIYRLAGLPRELAYAVWYFSAHVATFGASLYALRQLGLEPLAAAVAALVFAFGAPVVIQTSHGHLVWLHATPLAFLFGWRLLHSGRLGDLGLLLFFWAWQFLCSVYLGAFLTLLLLCAGTAALALPSTRASLRALPTKLRARSGVSDRARLSAGAVAVVLLGLALGTQLSVAREHGFSERVVASTLLGLPEPSSYLLADASRLYSWLGEGVETALRHEKQLFPGAGVLLLLIASFFAPKRSQAWGPLFAVAAVSLALLVVLTLRLDDNVTLYWPIALAPGFSVIRAPARIGLIMMWPVSIMVAIGFSWLLGETLGEPARAPRQCVALRRAAGVAVVAFLLFEQGANVLSSWPVEAVLARKARIAALLPRDAAPDAIIAMRSQPKEGWWLAEIDAIVLAQDRGLVTINGYSGNFPIGFRPLERCEDIDIRLSGYTTGAGLSPEGAQALFERIVPLGFDGDCGLGAGEKRRFAFADRPGPSSEEPIALAMVPYLRLEVVDVEPLEDGRLRATLRITNASAHDLEANFIARRRVLRFSWRYQPLAADWPRTDHWTTRSELLVSVPGGSQAVQTLTLPPPEEPGRYTLQLTMLQEHYVWLHDYGLELAAATRPVVRDAAGGVRLGERVARDP